MLNDVPLEKFLPEIEKLVTDFADDLLGQAGNTDLDKEVRVAAEAKYAAVIFIYQRILEKAYYMQYKAGHGT